MNFEEFKEGFVVVLSDAIDGLTVSSEEEQLRGKIFCILILFFGRVESQAFFLVFLFNSFQNIAILPN